ncbi:hypothetical protein ACHAWF_007838 [Thalassiosira exigua]
MADETPLIGTESKGKQGHRVLCCCDSRKAVILVSLVALVLMILGLIGVIKDHTGNSWTIASLSISIAFYLLVIWGAIRFHRCAVLCSFIWEIVAMVFMIIGAATYNWSLVSGQEKESAIAAVVIILLWRMLVLYSLATFLREVRNGIMSPETHKRERYSCCCNV